jgi:hypothetical protein
MMTPKVALRWAAGAALVLASGSLLAAAQSSQQSAAAGAAAQQSATAGDVRAQDSVQTLTVGGLPTGNTGAYHGPQSRVSALSIAECEGLGGKVVDVADKSCPQTGKVCYTADKNGVIHHSCITILGS